MLTNFFWNKIISRDRTIQRCIARNNLLKLRYHVSRSSFSNNRYFFLHSKVIHIHKRTYTNRTTMSMNEENSPMCFDMYHSLAYSIIVKMMKCCRSFFIIIIIFFLHCTLANWTERSKLRRKSFRGRFLRGRFFFGYAGTGRGRGKRKRNESRGPVSIQESDCQSRIRWLSEY